MAEHTVYVEGLYNGALAVSGDSLYVASSDGNGVSLISVINTRSSMPRAIATLAVSQDGTRSYATGDGSVLMIETDSLNSW